jgi:hypothetical protein
MYCKNCGQKLSEGDKFCNACGQKIASDVDNVIGQPANTGITGEKIAYGVEHFGADAKDKTDSAAKPEGIPKPTSPTEEFNWNIHTFPGQEVTKTEEPEFNWVPVAATTDAPAKEPAADATTFSPTELNWEAPAQTDEIWATQPSHPEPAPAKLEEELFGNLDLKADTTRKQAEEIDKFFTFNKKNEEFQSLLNKEYEKIKTGNVLSDELDKANVLSEERFAVRKPEDPMEELFVSSGVVKGYQPKEFSTNVLDKIDAAEAEKKVKEDAARLIEEERAKAEAERLAKEKAEAEAQERLRLQGEEQARLQAEEQARLLQAQEQARLQAEEQARLLQAQEQAKLQAEEQARLQAQEQARLQAEEQARLQAQEQARLQAEEQARLQAQEQKAQSIVEPEPAPVQEPQEFDPLSNISETKDRNDDLFTGFGFDENRIAEEIKEEEATPAETIRAVDKAAILAGMASANKMVEMDRAAAAQDAGQQGRASGVELPDFLGHPELQEELPAAANDQMNDNRDAQLLDDEMAKKETGDTILDDLFLTEEQEQTDPVQELTEGQMAERLDQQAPILQDADNAILSDADSSNAAAAGITAITEPTGDEGNSEEKSGKGRVVLKVFLVILIILLAIEVAGVAIKIIAPTSGAAKFIDKQLNKVITLVTDEPDKQYSVFAASEKIRTTQKEDKTEFIKLESNKNKGGNIKSITYDANLKLDPDKKYKDSELSLTQELSDIAWYKNAANKQVYYDQAIVGAIIAYNSQKVNMINYNDSSVLNLIKEGTALHNKVSKMGKAGSTVTFTSLKIGQIRQAAGSFYLWVSEETKDSSNGNSTTEKVYELQADGKTMKIVGESKI